jgi:pimeloyl-[acyl-carrier protein] synthase
VTTSDTVPTAVDEEFVEFVMRPELRADPYPFYHRLRAFEPVHKLPFGIWLVSSHEHVSQILRDGRFSSDERNAAVQAISGYDAKAAFTKVFETMLVFRDEPDHKRLRDLVQKAFTRKVVENLRPRIESVVGQLTAGFAERGGGDLISEFAYPLPVVVICELLGVPVEDRDRFQHWARDFARRFEVQLLRTPESEERGDAATGKLLEYFEGLLESKRKTPGNDVMSSLNSVEDQGDRLTHDEVLATCLLLLLAGHETTANLLGNGVLALLRHRDQWERLVVEPALVRPAVEELLRYDSPVQVIERIALKEMSIGDQTIAPGEQLGILLGAANRDPQRFPDPDRLDIGRDDEPLISFGAGVHFCLGAPLARLEARIALDSVVRTFPNLQLATDEPKWRPSFVLRGLEELPVTTG